MIRPYAEDWRPYGLRGLMYSESLGLYWSAKEQKYRDQLSAEWAGWTGAGEQLRNIIQEHDHE